MIRPFFWTMIREMKKRKKEKEKSVNSSPPVMRALLTLKTVIRDFELIGFA